MDQNQLLTGLHAESHGQAGGGAGAAMGAGAQPYQYPQQNAQPVRPMQPVDAAGRPINQRFYAPNGQNVLPSQMNVPAHLQAPAPQPQMQQQPQQQPQQAQYINGVSSFNTGSNLQSQTQVTDQGQLSVIPDMPSLSPQPPAQPQVQPQPQQQPQQPNMFDNLGQPDPLQGIFNSTPQQAPQAQPQVQTPVQQAPTQQQGNLDINVDTGWSRDQNIQVARDLAAKGWGQEQVQQFLDTQADIYSGQVEQQQQELQSSLEIGKAHLRGAWGDKYSDNVAQIESKLMAQYPDKQMRESKALDLVKNPEQAMQIINSLAGGEQQGSIPASQFGQGNVQQSVNSSAPNVDDLMTERKGIMDRTADNSLSPAYKKAEFARKQIIDSQLFKIQNG